MIKLKYLFLQMNRRRLSRRSRRRVSKSRARSLRTRKHLSFGAKDDKSLLGDFIALAGKDPKAAAAVLHMGVTTFLQNCDIKEFGAIDKCSDNNIKATRELHEFLKSWDPNDPHALKPNKFGGPFSLWKPSSKKPEKHTKKLEEKTEKVKEYKKNAKADEEYDEDDDPEAKAYRIKRESMKVKHLYTK